jgi:hypothetical protein
MAFSGMLRRVGLVRTDVSEELSASIIRVTRIGDSCHPDDGGANSYACVWNLVSTVK